MPPLTMELTSLQVLYLLQVRACCSNSNSNSVLAKQELETMRSCNSHQWLLFHIQHLLPLPILVILKQNTLLSQQPRVDSPVKSLIGDVITAQKHSQLAKPIPALEPTHQLDPRNTLQRNRYMYLLILNSR